ncbi:MAG: FHA domain-containing protein [Deltaproteobacteria bacterium]|nr:MAG: FHA domain-containing protein [Deltaproteobacteria bacterium]
MAELILKLKDREIKRINISKVETTLGRDPECDLFIDNIGISREHCRILYRGGRFFLRDNGSSNGTFLNNNRVTHESELHDQDEIQLGKYRVIFSGAGGMPEHLLGAGEEEGKGGKKVRSVFGTVQFSPDEIQNLLSASGESPAPSVQLPTSRPEEEEEEEPASLNKQAQLNVILGVLVAVLFLLLIVVLLAR